MPLSQTGIALGDDVNNIGTHTNRGMAWRARMTFTDKYLRNQTEVTKTMFALLKAAMADGAYIHSLSWHDSSHPYSAIALDVDRFVWENEDNLVVASASSSGRISRTPRYSKELLMRSGFKKTPLRDEYR